MSGWKLVLVLVVTLILSSQSYAQYEKTRLEDGCLQYLSSHIRLITDLPETDEIADLVTAFESAMPQWKAYFAAGDVDDRAWQATVYLMGDRKRFVQLGYLTPDLPPFLEGYQAGDRLFVCEQPSAYYRRHLMLHEGTHWYMAKLYGGAGPPWYMEGTAEALSTHAWNNSQLVLGHIPTNNSEVPYWGRLGIVRDDFKAGRAPSIESIMRYDNTAHRQVEPYAWSWLAVLFATNNPRVAPVLKELVGKRLDYSPKLTKAMFTRLKSEWPMVRMEWSGFASDFDFGANPKLCIPKLTGDETKLSGNATLIIEANRGWQSSGLIVNREQRLVMTATGRYVIETRPERLMSEPQGLSLRYHRGERLGKLVAAIVQVPTEEESSTQKWTPLPVGKLCELESPGDGILFFKVNEDAAGLHDNSGTISITIEERK